MPQPPPDDVGASNHENQPPEFAPRDLWADDVALREAVAREGGQAFAPALARYAAIAGDDLHALSFDAHRDRPRLHTTNALARASTASSSIRTTTRSCAPRSNTASPRLVGLITRWSPGPADALGIDGSAR